MARVGECVDREPVFSVDDHIVLQTNVARDAPRAATTIPKLMTSVENQIFSKPIICD